MANAIRVGIQLSSLGLPFRKALPIAAGLGVTGVEIDARSDLLPSDLSGTALRQIRKMLDDLNLRVVAVRFQTRRGYGVLEDLDRRVAATKEVFQMATSLNCGIVVNQIGKIAPAKPVRTAVNEAEIQDHTSMYEVDERETMRSVMSDLCRFGLKTGAQLACETGSEPIETLVEFIEGLPETSVGIAFNPGNLIANGFRCVEIGNAARHILLVHARDSVSDLARGRGMDVPLGRGMADFPQIAAELEQHRFSGYFVVDQELRSDGLAQLQNSVAFLQNID